MPMKRYKSAARCLCPTRREPRANIKLRAKVVGGDAISKAFLAATNRVGLSLNYDSQQLTDYRIGCVGTALKLYNQMQALGVDIQTIQSIVGHADTEMTEHYLHVQESIRQSAIQLFSEAFSA